MDDSKSIDLEGKVEVEKNKDSLAEEIQSNYETNENKEEIQSNAAFNEKKDIQSDALTNQNIDEFKSNVSSKEEEDPEIGKISSTHYHECSTANSLTGTDVNAVSMDVLEAGQEVKDSNSNPASQILSGKITFRNTQARSTMNSKDSSTTFITLSSLYDSSALTLLLNEAVADNPQLGKENVLNKVVHVVMKQNSREGCRFIGIKNFRKRCRKALNTIYDESLFTNVSNPKNLLNLRQSPKSFRLSRTFSTNGNNSTVHSLKSNRDNEHFHNLNPFSFNPSLNSSHQMTGPNSLHLPRTEECKPDSLYQNKVINAKLILKVGRIDQTGLTAYDISRIDSSVEEAMLIPHAPKVVNVLSTDKYENNYHITCGDIATLNFVKRVVLEQGSFVIIEPFEEFTVWVPNNNIKREPSNFLPLLFKSNFDLEEHHFQVYSVISKEEGNTFIIGVDGKSVKMLEQRGFQLNWGMLGHVTFKHLTNP